MLWVSAPSGIRASPWEGTPKARRSRAPGPKAMTSPFPLHIHVHSPDGSREPTSPITPTPRPNPALLEAAFGSPQDTASSQDPKRLRMAAALALCPLQHQPTFWTEPADSRCLEVALLFSLKRAGALGDAQASGSPGGAEQRGKACHEGTGSTTDVEGPSSGLGGRMKCVGWWTVPLPSAQRGHRAGRRIGALRKDIGRAAPCLSGGFLCRSVSSTEVGGPM